MKRLNVEVPEEFHSRLKDRAKKLDISIKELVIAVLEDNLNFHIDKGTDYVNKNFDELRYIAKHSPLPQSRVKAERELIRRIRGVR